MISVWGLATVEHFLCGTVVINIPVSSRRWPVLRPTKGCRQTVLLEADPMACLPVYCPYILPAEFGLGGYFLCLSLAWGSLTPEMHWLGYPGALSLLSTFQPRKQLARQAPEDPRVGSLRASCSCFCQPYSTCCLI